MFPCGHPLDLNYLPPLSITLQEGTIMVALEDHILAMRQDDPEDLSWGKFAATRNASPHSRTLFTAIEALKYTKQIDIKATIARLDSSSSSSVLQIDFVISLHQSLLSNSLSCKYSIDTAKQDLVYFIFPSSSSKNNNQSYPSFSENPIKDLYTHLKPAATTQEPPPGIQPEALNPKLLPFQRRSVAWCLKRECGIVTANGEVEYAKPTITEKLPFSWEQITTPSGVDLFINRLCGLLCLADPQLVLEEPEPRGGILAEEMGLGKTVEMLALILLSRRKLELDTPPEEMNTTFGTDILEKQLAEAHLDDRVKATTSKTRGNNNGITVSAGTSSSTMIKSAATLIITPASILHQWASEIENHAPSLRVFIYNEAAYERITTEQLATQYDVVLTTYWVLSQEIHYANHYDRPRRHE
ncbi:hypothetical protein BGZ65_010334, partial [Modicella reniformis]